MNIFAQDLKKKINSISELLEKSLNTIAETCASDKTDKKYPIIVKTFKELSKSSKEYNDLLKECCIEPGQRIENLHNKIEEVIHIK